MKTYTKMIEHLDANLSTDCATRLAKALDGVWEAISDGLELLNESEKSLIAEAAQDVGMRLISRMIMTGGDVDGIVGQVVNMAAQSRFMTLVKLNLDDLRKNPQ